MPLSGLMRDDLQVILCGGKGGVGKTTCAAAIGLYMAKQDKRTLVFSTDPAHSLSDSFDLMIGDKITQVNGEDNLYALEINAEEEFKDFKNGAREEIDEILRETLRAGFDMPFEREIYRQIMELSPPGLDELMALSKLNDIIKSREFDLIVIDTAAGAHTLRLLELPEILNRWFAKALVLLDKYRYVMSLPKTRQLIQDLKNDVDWIRTALIDSGRTEFVAITIPEAMGIYITEMMLKGLETLKMHAGNIVINYLIPPHVRCDYCASRRKWQIKRVREIHEKFPKYNIVEVPLFPREVTGVESLMNFAKVLFEAGYKPKFPGTRGGPILSTPETPRLDLLRRDLRFILFGGKGGCGKTTSSAATGIYMAKRGRKTLVISTDPQHSLPHSFDQRVGEEITPIEGVDNLYALEINAEKLHKDWMEKHKEEILEIARGATYFDEEDVEGFFDESIGPGMDEFMALLEIVNLMKRGEYDLYIFDTAPTGHTLRLLELPDAMSKWVRLMTAIRSKTQYIVKTFVGRGIREKADVFLEDLMNDIKRVKAALTDHKRTEFIPVTTLEEMAIKESERLVASLNSLHIPVRQIVVNGLVPPNPDCDWCTSGVEMQQKGLRNVRKKFPGFKIIGIPLFPREVLGINRLTEFAAALFGSERVI